MNWIDCSEALVNLDRVDYILFEEDKEFTTVYIYFTGRENPAKFHAAKAADLKRYFEADVLRKAE